MECTVNRVGERFLDQTELNGHGDRPDDLDRFAALGIAAIRYPVLWERTAPGDPLDADWSWPDERLGRLRQLGVRPIVGLVHHGSGPRETDLLDPSFPRRLAAYAGAVARRYPWVTDYTPVNEPLTTARFSALYGHWYPHRRDEGSFFRAVVTQCQGVVEAMRAIRMVTPAARLVQTEDLGETFSTPALAAQAAYENERRWLSLDLLTGRVVPGHPFWSRLIANGILERELAELADDPCPPDIVGINHYLTSERMLDDRLDRYPDSTHGSNGRQGYADVEAVRVCAEGPGGWRRLLRATWDRYGLPVAATEVHLSCTREEQMRWLAEAWEIAQDLRDDGVDIRAVTPWSLLGSFGWNRLVSGEMDYYEPGVFDLRAPHPRPTALAGLITELAAGRPPRHPVLAVPGWWRRPSRLLFPPVDGSGTDVTVIPDETRTVDAPGILIVGPASPTRDAFVASCHQRAIPSHCRDIPVDARSSVDLRSDLLSKRPWALVVTIPEAELGTNEVREVARLCRATGTDLLFCVPADSPPALASPGGPTRKVKSGEFPKRARHELRAGQASIASSMDGGPERFDPRTDTPFLWVTAGAATSPRGDVVGIDHHPNWTARVLVDAALDLLIDGERGAWHLTDRGLEPSGHMEKFGQRVVEDLSRRDAS